ncbi:hypothetical protein [Spirosoma radiotolerans]|uniref:Uncharacterized protein n=1 Tax=Spirosoma radiotolerans TaxID=1379870 RepID=A0A0E3ZRS7_9BACT|nr:hypothetical protein [Spirosoma radiotolerans]AKD53819.1 hypothetical protein SD10_01780 [Spirosoma radiotolerans]
MHLFLTTIDEYNQLREYACPLQQLDVAFKILNDIVMQGQTLLSSCIVEDNYTTSLPVKAFDGACFMAAMKELEQEWNNILSKPVRLASTVHHELRRMAQRRIEQSASRIAITEQTHNHLKTIRQRAKDLVARRPASANLLGYYDSLVNRYEVKLAKARFIHQLALDRFEQVW